MRKRLFSRPARAALLLVALLIVAVSATTALAASPTVKVGDFFFKAKTLTVSRGTSVTWKWVGAIGHNVTVKSGPMKFRSKTQVHGSYSHAFTKAGTYKLYCTIHPTQMTMTVIVR